MFICILNVEHGHFDIGKISKSVDKYEIANANVSLCLLKT